MFTKNIFTGLIFSAVLLLLTACGGGSSAPTTPVINGVIQKGPFISIGNMAATKLNDDGSDATESKDLTGLSINKGLYQSFELPWTGWTRFSVTGSYLDENTGATVDLSTPLTAVVFVNNGPNQVNINLFTTLADELSKNKIATGAGAVDLKTSLQGDGQQEIGAEAEIRNKFGLNPGVNLAGLDLTKTGNGTDANDALLLYSAAFTATQGASVSTIATDGITKVDELLLSLTNTITAKGITVTELTNKVNNVKPVGQNDAATTDEEQPVDINVLDNDSDADNDSLTITNLVQPANGTATVNNGAVTYTPDADFSGNDSFTYTPNDGHFDGDAVTVAITVNNINDAPVGVIDAVTTQEDQSLSINVLDNDTDVDGDTLTIKTGSLTAPANGTAVISGLSIQYTPNANFTGTDSFSYIPTDGNLDGQATTVTVTVNNVNDAPVGVADAATTNEDQPVTIPVLDNDTDSDQADILSIKAGSLSTPAHGTVSIVGTGVQYTPAANYFGTDSFTYIPTDGSLDGGATTVTVTITSVNDVPTLTGAPATSVAQDAVYNFTPAGADVDGDLLTYSITNKPDWATFDSGTGQLTGTPGSADVGTTTGIVISVTDGIGGTVSLPAFDLEVVSANAVINPTSTGLLNDTAFTTSFDGNIGRDATSNDGTNGYAGFDFTPLDSASRQTSAANAACVKDNVTGLIWELKTTDGGIHDASNTYATADIASFVQSVNSANFCGANDWRLPSREELRSLVKMDEMSRNNTVVGIDTNYFPNTQASHKIDCVGIIYSNVDSSLRSSSAATPFTATQLSAIQDVLDSLLASNSDYAQSCSDFTPQDYENNLIGTSTKKPRARGIGYITTDPATIDNHTWTIFFDDSEIDHEIWNGEKRYIRLVRGTKKLDANTANNDSRFQINANGTVKDLTTGLTWKRCLEGYAFNDNGTSNNASDDSCVDPNPDPAVTTDTRFTWADAISKEGQNFAGVTTWRVPNLKELASIAVYDGSNPAINTSVFPSTESVFTWTNTELPNSSTAVWVISFGNGGDRVIDKSQLRPVRLVHD